MVMVVEGEVEMSEEYLSKEERKSLLKLARDTIAASLAKTPLPPTNFPPGKLVEPGAAFVTLKIHDDLRGCIGYTEAFQPLYRTVMSCALAAAFQDPRFAPLSEKEFADIAIDISVLTPLRKIKDPSEVIVGKHGIQISSRGRRGLLLPQVATEYNWDRETFLGHTCLKAGLPPDEWKSGRAEIYVFEAEVFSEEELD
jgi:AmmeMemoRadiSam system protein A